MSPFVFAAVLSSALFQSTWNFFAKKTDADRVALLIIGLGSCGVVTLPIALFMTDLHAFNAEWWPYLLATAFFHCTYISSLGWAYSLGDISVVYPVARGVGIAGTALLVWAFGLHEFSLVGIGGIGAVFGGTFLIGTREGLQSGSSRKAFFAAVLVSLSIMSYSAIDSEAVKQIPPLFYLSMMMLLTPLFALPFLFHGKLRSNMSIVLRKHKIQAFWIGNAGGLAYLIVLWAFQYAPASYVVALREVSIVMTSVMGILFLKERLYRGKTFGIALIVTGAILLRLA